MSPLETEGIDVDTDCLGQAQTVQRKQGDERMVARRRESGGDEDGAELGAVEVGNMGLVVDSWSTDMHGGRVLDDPFFLGVAVEADDGGQPASDRGACATSVFEVTGEALDVDATDIEQVPVVLPAPCRELTQVQRVRLAGEAALGREKAEQGRLLNLGEVRLVPLDDGRRGRRHDTTSNIVAGGPPRCRQHPGRRKTDTMSPSNPAELPLTRAAHRPWLARCRHA